MCLYLYKCQRSCKFEYLDSSFVYSMSIDAVYCIDCAMFLSLVKQRSFSSFADNELKACHNILRKPEIKPKESDTEVAPGIIEKF